MRESVRKRLDANAAGWVEREMYLNDAVDLDGGDGMEVDRISNLVMQLQ
jgi:hypothetical protein